MGAKIKENGKRRVALITDSSCDLPEEIIRAHGINILPLKIVYSDREYQDRIEISPNEVYARMPEEVPRTSMPSTGEVVQLLERLKSEGFREVLAVFISSGLSGTHDMFKTIAQQMENLYVEVLDSLNLSMGLGFQVCEAAEQIKRNRKLEEIAGNLRLIRQKVKVFYVIPTLQYLRKGGRIGLVEGSIGDLLSIKPIISVNAEGKYFTVTKVRGRKASLEKLLEITQEAIGSKCVDLAVMHGGAYQEGKQLQEKISKTIPNIRKMTFGQISSVLGVHTGPGLVGIVFYEV